MQSDDREAQISPLFGEAPYSNAIALLPTFVGLSSGLIPTTGDIIKDPSIEIAPAPKPLASTQKQSYGSGHNNLA